jgi:hypothetical protein
MGRSRCKVLWLLELDHWLLPARGGTCG